MGASRVGGHRGDKKELFGDDPEAVNRRQRNELLDLKFSVNRSGSSNARAIFSNVSDSRNRVAVLDARHAAPQQTSALLDVALG
jgi:hypothetical protein